MTTLIKNGTAYINGKFEARDILVKNDKIHKVAKHIAD